MVLVGSHTTLLGGDPEHVGTDIKARPSYCAETLKARGTVLARGQSPAIAPAAGGISAEYAQQVRLLGYVMPYT